MDVLLCRQYALINAMGRGGMTHHATSSSAGDSTGLSPHSQTLGAHWWCIGGALVVHWWCLARLGTQIHGPTGTLHVSILSTPTYRNPKPPTTPIPNPNPEPQPTPTHPERIEDLRRNIGAASASSSADELELLELLGEGSYGKVFRCASANLLSQMGRSGGRLLPICRAPAADAAPPPAHIQP